MNSSYKIMKGHETLRRATASIAECLRHASVPTRRTSTHQIRWRPTNLLKCKVRARHRIGNHANCSAGRRGQMQIKLPISLCKMAF
jgi:hypothetical protein